MTREEVKTFMDEFIRTHEGCEKTDGWDKDSDYYRIGTSILVSMYANYMSVITQHGREDMNTYVYYKHISNIRQSFTPDTWFICTWLEGTFTTISAKTKGVA